MNDVTFVSRSHCSREGLGVEFVVSDFLCLPILGRPVPLTALCPIEMCPEPSRQLEWAASGVASGPWNVQEDILLRTDCSSEKRKVAPDLGHHQTVKVGGKGKRTQQRGQHLPVLSLFKC